MTNKEMNEKILALPGKKKEVAHHETAHLVALIAYSKQLAEFPYIERVSIAAEESHNLGYVRYRSMVIGVDELFPILPAEAKPFFEEKIKCAIKQVLAGPASDFILFDEYEIDAWGFFELFWDDGQGDLEQAIRHYKILDEAAQLKDFEPSQPLFSLFEEAVKDVQKHWPLIEEVAGKLESTLVIEGEELDSLVEALYEKI